MIHRAADRGYRRRRVRGQVPMRTVILSESMSIGRWIALMEEGRNPVNVEHAEDLLIEEDDMEALPSELKPANKRVTYQKATDTDKERRSRCLGIRLETAE